MNIEGFINLDKRISLIINEKSLGAGLSRNIGISKSKGKYISFIDAGPKGILLGFKNNFFKDTEKLLDFIRKSSWKIKIRHDQKLFMEKHLVDRDEKIEQVLEFINKIEDLKS